MNKIEGKDIVILALARWDGPYSSTAFSIAQELSKTSRVFYIDHPFTMSDVARGWRSQQIRKRMRSLFLGTKPCQPLPGNSNFFYVIPPMALPINFLWKGRMYNLFSSLNNYLISMTLKRVCAKEQIANFIFLNIFNPFYLSNIQDFNPCCTVYYCVDNMSESKYINKHGVEREQKLMSQFDLTISTSRFLQKYAALYTSRSHYLPNAADFSLFTSTFLIGTDQRPVELMNITRKIVGYIGNVEDRIDFALLLEVVKMNPDKIFLFIGPINSDQFLKLKFNQQDNVIAVGRKNIQELPTYLKFIDCAIIPFKKNKLTEGIYPLKINEYLASGRPVVTTSFSEDILEFKDIVQVADSAVEFSQAIQSEMDADDNEKRRNRAARASSNTWEDRAKRLQNLLSIYS